MLERAVRDPFGSTEVCTIGMIYLNSILRIDGATIRLWDGNSHEPLPGVSGRQQELYVRDLADLICFKAKSMPTMHGLDMLLSNVSQLQGYIAWNSPRKWTQG